MSTENVAVLFTDVVGSTALAQNVSAETADEVRRGHFSILRQAVAEAGGTEVKNLGDARAALAAADRAGRLTAADHLTAKTELIDLFEEVTFVDITDELIADAADLAETDALRGYEAVHLAAAIAIGATVLTSADEALCDAAEHHGLRVANPLDP